MLAICSLVAGTIRSAMKEKPQVSAKHEVKLEPVAYARFERAVDVVAKSPPIHRTKRPPRRRTSRREAEGERLNESPTTLDRSARCRALWNTHQGARVVLARRR